MAHCACSLLRKQMTKSALLSVRGHGVHGLLRLDVADVCNLACVALGQERALPVGAEQYSFFGAFEDGDDDALGGLEVMSASRKSPGNHSASKSRLSSGQCYDSFLHASASTALIDPNRWCEACIARLSLQPCIFSILVEQVCRVPSHVQWRDYMCIACATS